MNKEEFGKYLSRMYQDGMLMLSVGLGHDLGLFKVICEASKPISVEEVAKTLNLKERFEIKNTFTYYLASSECYVR
jgi:hypothetical protein